MCTQIKQGRKFRAGIAALSFFYVVFYKKDRSEKPVSPPNS
jgi:hypothetical protein